MTPTTVQLNCQLTVTITDPEAITALAVHQLRNADINWPSEKDDLETAAAHLKTDLLNSLCALADPTRILTDLPGAEVTSGHIWAEPANQQPILQLAQ